MKKIMVFMAAVIVLSACSQNTDRERNGESVNIKPAAKTETSASAGMSGARSNMRITKPTELLPEIAEKYSGVSINVINQSDNFVSDIVIPFGEKTAIADTDLEILVSSYFTNFTMADGGVINVSMDENNP
ncbi:MAG: hypothetical protein K2N67_03090, partial [Mucispirillum sp.]|nr:hypothetical protein [Mucispirillum sp.]